MDLTSVVERTKSMEQRLGVSLQGVYVEYKDGALTINFELHVEGEGQLSQNTDVVAAAYDHAGRVIATQDYFLLAENVFGFVVGSIYLPLDTKQISKIRLYPQKA